MTKRRKKKKIKENIKKVLKTKQSLSKKTLNKNTNTALRLLADINDGLIDPKDLNVENRRSMVFLLSDKRYSTTQMATMFNKSKATIREDIKKNREMIGREVSAWTVDTIIGDLAIASEKLYGMALDIGEIGLAWTIKRDFAKQLKEMGIIRGVQDNQGLRITIEGMGDNYERATKALSVNLDPSITGEVIDVVPLGIKTIKTPSRASKSLKLSKRLISRGTGEPNIEIINKAS